jgi:hypothetical protein
VVVEAALYIAAALAVEQISSLRFYFDCQDSNKEILDN